MIQNNQSKTRATETKQEFLINLQFDRNDRLYKLLSEDNKINIFA